MKKNEVVLLSVLLLILMLGMLGIGLFGIYSGSYRRKHSGGNSRADTGKEI